MTTTPPPRRTDCLQTAHRRKLATTLALLVSPWALPLAARAQAGTAAAGYPNRAVRWICPSSPGAGTDATTRAFAQIANEAWKQPCVVDNRAGASGMIGLELLAAAPPDGYTLGMITASQLIDAVLTQKYPFDEKKPDFTPLTQLAAVPLLLVAHPSTRITTLDEMVVRARAHPNELNYSSGGAGGITHLAMEVFLKKAGIRVTHVPYKGSGPAVADLLAGHVQFSFATPAAVVGYVKAGKLNAIGVSSENPSPLAPGVPTFKQLGLPGIYLSAWYGLFGPAKMPQDLVDRISSSIVTASQPAAIHDRLLTAGIDPVLDTPAEFTRFLSRERDQWLAVARDIGFKHEG
jgi:tripartite-type tricarboxylate transporter receptor subunit TctC